MQADVTQFAKTSLKSEIIHCVVKPVRMHLKGPIIQLES